MDIRISIYNAIKGVLPDWVKYCAPWNHNVEFIEQEDAWPCPAVFLEFDTIEWQPTKAQSYHTRGTLRLHIVTEYNGDDTVAWRTSAEVTKMLDGLSGDGFRITSLMANYTNHNHEDLIEEIVSFSFSGDMNL